MFADKRAEDGDSNENKCKSCGTNTEAFPVFPLLRSLHFALTTDNIYTVRNTD